MPDEYMTVGEFAALPPDVQHAVIRIAPPTSEPAEAGRQTGEAP